MASQCLEPPIPCDVRGTSLQDDQLSVASVDQRMACEDLDRFVHPRDRYQNRITFRDEFQYPLEIRDYAHMNACADWPLSSATRVKRELEVREGHRPISLR
jgi:hypothetical protein